MSLPYFKFGCSTICTYCGDDSDSMDHVMVKSGQAILRSKKNAMTGYGPVTPSCHACNSRLLNSRGFDTFYERCQHVSWRLEKKALPIDWSKRQLGELDYGLRGYVEREQEKRKWWRCRADWFQSRGWVVNLEPLLSEAVLDAKSHRFSSELFGYFESTVRFVRLLRPDWGKAI